MAVSRPMKGSTTPTRLEILWARDIGAELTRAGVRVLVASTRIALGKRALGYSRPAFPRDVPQRCRQPDHGCALLGRARLRHQLERSVDALLPRPVRGKESAGPCPSGAHHAPPDPADSRRDDRRPRL